MKSATSRAAVPIGPSLLLADVALLVALPVAFLILGSFSHSRIPGEISWGQLGLRNYVAVELVAGTLLSLACFTLTIAS